MHCPACKGNLGIKHGTPNSYGVYQLEPIPCPGCGHEEQVAALEAKLAEAQRQEAASIQALCEAQAQINTIERQLADVMTGLVALSPSLANYPRPVSLAVALDFVTAEYTVLIQDHAALEREVAEATTPVHQIVYPCGCIACVCEGDTRCYGCGAKDCRQPGSPADHVPGGKPMTVAQLVAKLAEAQAELTTMREEHAIWEKHSLVQIVKQRDALSATLEQARGVISAARVVTGIPLDNTQDIGRMLDLEDALAALDMRKAAEG